MTQTLEHRVIELESRLAWQEETLHSLSAELISQQKALELLELRLRQQEARAAAAETPVFRGEPGDEVPPHW